MPPAIMLRYSSSFSQSGLNVVQDILQAVLYLMLPESEDYPARSTKLAEVSLVTLPRISDLLLPER